MAFKVVATPFGRRVESEYPYEHEALRPLGITITTASADSDAEYINQVRDADAIMAGGREMTADIISQLENCKVIATGGVGVDRVDLDAATAHGIAAAVESIDANEGVGARALEAAERVAAERA